MGVSQVDIIIQHMCEQKQRSDTERNKFENHINILTYLCDTKNSSKLKQIVALQNQCTFGYQPSLSLYPILLLLHLRPRWIQTNGCIQQVIPTKIELA